MSAAGALRNAVLAGAVLLLLPACDSPQEHARNLRIPGLVDFVCEGVPYDQKSQTCGQRSVWKEADWGTTAYITVYGVPSQERAGQIAQFVEDTRAAQRQQHIGVDLRVYSSPRSAGREPAHTNVFHKRF